jgi:small subunit ribosomal protein S5
MEQEVKNQNSTQPTPNAAPAAAPQRQQGGYQGGNNRGGGFRGGRGGGNNRGDRRPSRPMEKPEFNQKTLDIARVSRVTKGGKRFSFRTTLVAGDGKGKVGVGIAKGRDVAQSINKAYNQARKNMITVPLVNGSIPYQVEAKYSSAVVIIKPSRGGVKAGGPVRAVAQMAGITSLTGKLTERTNNKLNIAMATMNALAKLRVVKK